MYYGVLVGTQASRIHGVSVPVDVGVRYASKPQDMAIEHWLNIESYDTQNVVDLAINFQTLPADRSKEFDEHTIYTLVTESQVHTSASCC